MKTLFLILMLAAQSQAALVGKFDLEPTVHPLALREIHDGQWIAGIGKDFWRLESNGREILHIGLFQAWNAEHGNASFGPSLGLKLPGITPAIGKIGEALQLPNFFKPAQYLASCVSLESFVGYRPIHTADVLGEIVYGFGARLNIEFGLSELQNGL